MNAARRRTSKRRIPTDAPVCKIGALTFARINDGWHQFITANGRYCGIIASCGALAESAKLLDAWWKSATEAEARRKAFSDHYWGEA